jgi:hypothetical protein
VVAPTQIPTDAIKLVRVAYLLENKQVCLLHGGPTRIW